MGAGKEDLGWVREEEVEGLGKEVKEAVPPQGDSKCSRIPRFYPAHESAHCLDKT